MAEGAQPGPRGPTGGTHETLSTPELAITSPQITPRWKEPAITSRSGMPRTSPHGVLEDLGTWPEGPQAELSF